MAFTLIDNNAGRSVRVSLKPNFFLKALNSPFVQKRKEGILPQDVDPGITDPAIKKILNLAESDFLDIGEVKQIDVKKHKGVFDAKVCAKCGEVTFVDKLRVSANGEEMCIPCSGYED